MAKPTTIDAYLAQLQPVQRAALERLRRLVHASAPGIEEGISYGMPVFRLNNNWLVYMAAATHHCALYGVQESYRGELKDYDTSGKGTLRFKPDEPLPATLVRKLLKVRIAQIARQR